MVNVVNKVNVVNVVVENTLKQKKSTKLNHKADVKSTTCLPCLPRLPCFPCLQTWRKKLAKNDQVYHVYHVYHVYQQFVGWKKMTYSTQHVYHVYHNYHVYQQIVGRQKRKHEEKAPNTMFTTFTTFTAFTMFTKISKNLYSAPYRASYVTSMISIVDVFIIRNVVIFSFFYTMFTCMYVHWLLCIVYEHKHNFLSDHEQTCCLDTVCHERSFCVFLIILVLTQITFSLWQKISFCWTEIISLSKSKFLGRW